MSQKSEAPQIYTYKDFMYASKLKSPPTPRLRRTKKLRWAGAVAKIELLIHKFIFYGFSFTRKIWSIGQRLDKLGILLFLLFTSQTFAANLTVTFINVGQIGDSILIQTSLGRNILIDGGFEYAGEENVCPHLIKKKIKKLDTIVLPHPHDDHCGGLEYILKKFTVSEVLDTGIASPSEPYRNFLLAVKKNGAKYKIVSIGDEYNWGGVKAVILNAKNEKLYDKESFNNHSIVIKLTYKKVSFLFTGDIEREAEDFLLSNNIKSTVLKIPHHGSSSSSTYRFLKKVSPQVAVINVGNPNDYGFSVAMNLEKLKQLGIETYRTDLNGNIEITSDGKKISVKTERKSKKDNSVINSSSIDENFWFHLENGWFLVRSGKFKKAIPELEEAVRIFPGFSDAHSKLGFAYKKTKNILLAKEEFLKALSIDSNDYYSLVHLGLIYNSEGNNKDALKFFRKALANEPYNTYTSLLKEKIREIEKSN